MDPDEVAALRSRRVRILDHVVHRSFAAETVLLNLETAHYHGLNTSGGRLFEALRATGSVDAAARAVAAEFDVPVDDVLRDAVDLCEKLAQRGLIEFDDAVG